MFTKLLLGFLILVSVGLNTSGQILLKQGTTQVSVALKQGTALAVAVLNPSLLGGLVAYGLSTIFYILVLGKVNLSIAYPLVIGLTVISTVMAGAVLFGEKVPTTAWVGVGLVLSGISAIALTKPS